MNMDGINKWLTLAANLGVMAGIFLLVIELSQEASIASADSFQQTQSELSEWRAMILADKELTNLWRDFVNESGTLDDVQEEDRMRLGFLILSLFSAYESAFYSESYGVYSEIEWEQIDAQACIEFGRANRLGMIIPFQLMTTKYREHLQTNC